jgi:hypothetical protein
MSEKLCIFCEHFAWEVESQWGMGSTMTGPMMDGGNAMCRAGRYTDSPFPRDEGDWREIILRGKDCPDYKPPTTAATNG